MLPLVRAPPKDQRVLLPDTTPGEVKAHGVKRTTEDQALGIRVEHIDAAVIRQVVMHTVHGLLGKLVRFLIRKVVILDRPGSPFIRHEVGKIGQDQIRFHAVQHRCAPPGIYLRKAYGGVTRHRRIKRHGFGDIRLVAVKAV